MNRMVVHWKSFILTSISIVVILTIPTACAKAEFQLSPLEITPVVVATGIPATIDVDVANIGGADGTYTATMTVDGFPSETKVVAVAAGTTQRVTFTLVKQVASSYNIDIGGSSGTLQVLTPAEFELGELTVNRKNETVGFDVSIKMVVNNIGEAEGSYEVTLKVNGQEEDTQEITVAPGGYEIVWFTVVKRSAGIYDVDVNGKTEKVRFSPEPPPLCKGFTDWINFLFIAYPMATWHPEEIIGTIFAVTGPLEGDVRPTITLSKKGIPKSMTPMEYVIQSP